MVDCLWPPGCLACHTLTRHVVHVWRLFDACVRCMLPGCCLMCIFRGMLCSPCRVQQHHSYTGACCLSHFGVCQLMPSRVLSAGCSIQTVCYHFITVPLHKVVEGSTCALSRASLSCMLLSAPGVCVNDVRREAGSSRSLSTRAASCLQGHPRCLPLQKWCSRILEGGLAVKRLLLASSGACCTSYCNHKEIAIAYNPA